MLWVDPEPRCFTPFLEIGLDAAERVNYRGTGHKETPYISSSSWVGFGWWESEDI